MQRGAFYIVAVWGEDAKQPSAEMPSRFSWGFSDFLIQSDRKKSWQDLFLPLMLDLSKILQLLAQTETVRKSLTGNATRDSRNTQE